MPISIEFISTKTTYLHFMKIQNNQPGVGIALGAGIGAALGVALGDIAMGVALGASVGIIFGFGQRQQKKKITKGNK